ncbi:uncharacterized protein N0V89_000301 [Didymosphaeria variabile]|uniref:Uncharacterized protein n=1 Tax=Didymosphaeria variabile TaxID=1932322 RepID=A0A9W8XWG8_9PLEO|nr:uncharacterized protein N0V89_000301 [Didymosphaeria variabile]KAJ4359745.1 hypothetical protein N0V89_000301 [Didymosphaeria variabile]
MYHRGHNNNYVGRAGPSGNRAGTPGARPDPGRGSIMSGSRAQEVRRRRENHNNVGGHRGPQVARSLVDRITYTHGGPSGGGRGRGQRPAQGATHRGGRGQAGNARPLTDRITGGNGMGNGRVAAQAANHVQINTTVDHNGFSIAPETQETSHNVTSQQPQDSLEGGAQEPTFPFDPLFDELPGPSAPQARAPVSAPQRVPPVPVNRVSNQHKPTRVVKNAVDIFQNAKLRAVLRGKKIREPKKAPGMLLRMGNMAHGIQGHELTSSSPTHDNGDDDEL